MYTDYMQFATPLARVQSSKPAGSGGATHTGGGSGGEGGGESEDELSLIDLKRMGMESRDNRPHPVIYGAVAGGFSKPRSIADINAENRARNYNTGDKYRTQQTAVREAQAA